MQSCDFVDLSKGRHGLFLCCCCSC